MTKREDIQQGRLDGLESEFRSLLPRVLKECASGRWGLFGQNDGTDGSKYLFWSDAEHLKSIATEIRSIRQGFGESNPDVERFLHHCSLRGSNVPGEPRLAQSLLDELESGSSALSWGLKERYRLLIRVTQVLRDAPRGCPRTLVPLLDPS